MYVLEAQDEPPETPAWVPLRRVFKQAFLSDLVRASTEDLPARASDAVPAAWRDGDRARFISAMRSLDGQPVKDLWIDRFATALLDVDLPAEALEALLKGQSDVSLVAGKRTLTVAFALLRLGSVGEARRTLDAYAAVSTDEAEHRLIATIQRAVTAGTPEGRPGSWPEAKVLLESLLQLRQPELAARVLSAFLGGHAELAGEDILAITDHCFAILRTARPHAALQLLAGLDPLARATGAHDAYLDALVELEHGDAPVAPALTEPLPGEIGEHFRDCVASALAAVGDRRAAIKRFRLRPGHGGPLSQGICELARVVGQDVLSSVAPRISKSTDQPKTIDVFPFNGELDMLELKLEAMGSWIDRFIIVEASQTFTGLPKPLTFPGAAERFGCHLDKIVYRPVEAFPPYLSSAWAREFYQRDQALHALAGICAADDVVIISDVDEMMDPQAVKAFDGIVAGADLRTACYFLNYEKLHQDGDLKTVLARWRVAARMGLSWLRTGVRMHLKSAMIPNAGWHLTSIGTADDLARKYMSFSHEEMAYADKPFFEGLIEQLKSQGLEGYRRLDDDALPEFVRRRREALGHLMLP